MKISIVVPTYNRAETLAKVLPSLLEQDYPDYEILFCDSNSTDETGKILEELSSPKIIHLKGNYRGRGEARNAGLKAAKGEIVLFTDADIIAEPNLLSEHARFHRENPKAAVVGCEVQVNSYREYQEVRKNPEQRRTLHPPSRKELSWLYFLTGNASAARESLMSVGGFDDNFTGYGHEDLELGYRLQRSGLKILYNRLAVNYHWHPVGFAEKCEKMRLAGISTVRFYHKHKDAQIKLKLGWNPLAFLWFAVLSRFPAWVEKKKQLNEKLSPFWQEIILQYCYLSGIQKTLKEGLS